MNFLPSLCMIFSSQVTYPPPPPSPSTQMYQPLPALSTLLAPFAKRRRSAYVGQECLLPLPLSPLPSPRPPSPRPPSSREKILFVAVCRLMHGKQPLRFILVTSSFQLKPTLPREWRRKKKELSWWKKFFPYWGELRRRKFLGQKGAWFWF